MLVFRDCNSAPTVGNPARERSGTTGALWASPEIVRRARGENVRKTRERESPRVPASRMAVT